MANGRLAKDVHQLQKQISALSCGQARITDVDDNLNFLMLDLLPKEGFYKGAKLRFKMQFDAATYPEECPFLVCLDHVFHPNIDPTDLDYSQNEADDYPGSNVCVSLMDDWTASMGLDHLVLSLLFLMHHPNQEDPLSPYFDGEDAEDFSEEIVQHTLRGNTHDGIPFPCLMVDGVSGNGIPACKAPKDKAISAFHNPGLLLRELLTVKAEAIQVQTASPESESRAESANEEYLDNLKMIMPAAEQSQVCDSGANRAIDSLELVPNKSSKADTPNLGLSQLHKALASLFLTVASDAEVKDAKDIGNAVAESSNSQAEFKSQNSCLQFRDILNNSEVGTLFSNILQTAGDFQMDRSMPTILSSDDDVD